jgi:cell division protein FtsL
VSSRAAVAAPAVPSRRIGQKPRPLAVPRGPRRISGPARRKAPDRSVGAPADGGPIVLGLIAALDGIANHRLLDRLLRGRAWIALVAFALIGIVTMQLGLLKLSGGIGRAIEREALLQRENAALSIENSELAAGARVQSLATGLGMEFLPAGALRFLTADPRTDPTKGAAALSASVRTASTSSEGSGAASTTAAPSQPGGSEAQAPAAAESQSAAAGEAKRAPAEPTPSGESGAPSGEAATAPGETATPSGESATAPTGTTPSGSQPSPTAAPAPNSSAEAAPAGGTQAGPQG